MTKKHCIVLSYDAFSQDNWAAASKLPHLNSLITRGATTTQVKSVYPTLTYVIHSSYVTGNYPDKHRVFHNNPFQPFVRESDQDWHWFLSDIKSPTIFEAARKKGLTTAALLWPVSGKAPITYNIPEIRAVRGENQALKILKSGSKLFTLELELKYGKVRQGIKQPYLDDFTTLCAVDTIKNKKPELFLLHLIDLDDHKHLKGTSGTHIDEVLARMDRRIGDIIHATKEAGTYDDTTFIIVGDHSQLDVRYKVYLNRLFADHGLIFELGGVPHWRAYVQAAGGAAYLHVRPGDTEAFELAMEILNDATRDERYGIEAIFDKQALEEMHVDPRFDVMLEARVGYCFDDDYTSEAVVDLHVQGDVYATHGYLPSKPGYTSNLILAGPTVKQGVELGEVSVVDIGPTIAYLLDLPLGETDGRALKEAFE